MELMKITEVTSRFAVSSRTLRYYEQKGLLASIRLPMDSYRYYDGAAIERLRQILVLRSMQIPIRDIYHLFENESSAALVEVFVKRLDTINDEIDTLSHLKQIVNTFLQAIQKEGIQTVASLPLLQEKLGGQATQLVPQLSYEQLQAVDRKLNRKSAVRIVLLPAMQMLTSIRKNDGCSDAKGFWQWVTQHSDWEGVSGNHRLFETQDISGEQSVFLWQIQSEHHDAGPFSCQTMPGGWFAVITVAADQISQGLSELSDMFLHHAQYELDYSRQSMIESVISPDEWQDTVDLLVPLKKRAVPIQHKAGGHTITNITKEQLLQAEPVVRSESVIFTEMIPHKAKAVDGNHMITYQFYDIDDHEVLHLHSYVLARQLRTKQKITVPFAVAVTFQVEKEDTELVLSYAEASIQFQFGKTQTHMILHMPERGAKERRFCFNFSVALHEKQQICWRVGRRYFAVLLGERVLYCGENFPYMQDKANVSETYALCVAGGRGVESILLFTITLQKLALFQPSKLSKGVLTMIQKPTNHCLPHLHPLVTYHYGENYYFDACMRMLMEYVEPDDFWSYSFFAGLSGDNFVQVYGKKERYNDWCNCLSAVWDGADMTRFVFDTIGYEVTHVSGEQIAENSRLYNEMIQMYINKEIPVLAKSCNRYLPIIGYEENGDILLLMEGEDPNPRRIGASEFLSCERELIFIGAQKKTRNPPELYRAALMRIAELLTGPDRFGCAFGASAFRAWAEELEKGRFIGQTQPLDFQEYGVYVCNFSTNVCAVSFDFLRRAAAVLPECEALCESYTRLQNQVGDFIGKLEELEGNFNVTLKALQDPVRRMAIGKVIREFSPLYEQFAAEIQQIFGME